MSVSPLAFARYFRAGKRGDDPLRDLVHGRHRVSALRLARPTPARTRTVIAMPVGSVASSDIGGAVVATGTYRRISAFGNLAANEGARSFIHESERNRTPMGHAHRDHIRGPRYRRFERCTDKRSVDCWMRSQRLKSFSGGYRRNRYHRSRSLHRRPHRPRRRNHRDEREE